MFPITINHKKVSKNTDSSVNQADIGQAVEIQKWKDGREREGGCERGKERGREAGN